MKRPFCFLFVMAIIFSLLLGGCSGAATTTPAATTSAKATTAAPTTTAKPVVTTPEPTAQFPLVKDKVTLTVFAGRDPNLTDLEKNQFTEWYEKLTNVHVQWEQVTVAEAQQKITLMLTSGSLPDVLMNSQISKTQVFLYGAQGLLYPLNDLIDKYGLNFKKVLMNQEYVRDQVYAPDGKIYGLPRTDEAYHTTTDRRMWINVKWLNDLGLKMPVSTDDYYNVLKAFKTQDPNSNGKTDELPLVTYKGQTHMQGSLLSAFVYTDIGNGEGAFLEVVNGKVNFVANTPAFQDGLEYLNKLYKENLMPPESFTMDVAQLLALGEASEQVLGSVGAHNYTQFTKNYGESGRYLEYELMPPLKGPDGVRWAVTRVYQANPTSFVMNSKCKIPEVVIRWIDFFFSEEGYHNGNSGAEGLVWRKLQPGEVNKYLDLNGKPALTVPIPRTGDLSLYDNGKNRKWGATVALNKTRALREGAGLYTLEDKDTATGTTKGLDWFLTYHEYRYKKWVEERHEPYKKKELVLYLRYTEDQLKKNVEFQTNISNYVRESINKFITGEMNIASDWDAYVKELDKRGVADYVNMLQGVYTASKK